MRQLCIDSALHSNYIYRSVHIFSPACPPVSHARSPPPAAIAWISPGRLAIAEEMRDPAVVVTVAPAEGGAVGAAAAAAVAVGAIALGSPLGVATLVVGRQ